MWRFNVDYVYIPCYFFMLLNITPTGKLRVGLIPVVLAPNRYVSITCVQA